MDTTIRNLKRQTGLPRDTDDAWRLLVEARKLRARTLSMLARRITARARTGLATLTRPHRTTSGHPAH